jgi:hypothetical protein
MIHAPRRWGRWLAAGTTATAVAGTALAVAGGALGSAPTPLATTAAVLAGATSSAGTGAGAASGSNGAGTGSTGSAPAGHPGCTAATFSTAQQRLETALSNRATALDRMSARVQKAAHLPAADASALEAILSAEQSSLDGGGITGLQATVPTETTCQQLASTAKQMVVDFRVYALVARQVNITVCSTGSLFAAQRAAAAEPTIAARISRAQQHGKDVSGAQQAFTDFEQQVSTATGDLSQIDVSTVLAQVPSDYPGDRSTLHDDLATMKRADHALKAARRDLLTIRRDLRGPASGNARRHGAHHAGSSAGAGASAGTTTTA